MTDTNTSSYPTAQSMQNNPVDQIARGIALRNQMNAISKLRNNSPTNGTTDQIANDNSGDYNNGSQ